MVYTTNNNYDSNVDVVGALFVAPWLPIEWGKQISRAPSLPSNHWIFAAFALHPNVRRESPVHQPQKTRTPKVN